MSKLAASSMVAGITRRSCVARIKGARMSEKVGVVGAGMMGAEIGLVFALAGHDVVLSDTGEAQLSAAMERLARALDRGIQRGDYKDEEKPLALAHISTSVSLDAFAECDF